MIMKVSENSNIDTCFGKNRIFCKNHKLSII